LRVSDRKPAGFVKAVVASSAIAVNALPSARLRAPGLKVELNARIHLDVRLRATDVGDRPVSNSQTIV
jgi:hypothetical protein